MSGKSGEAQRGLRFGQQHLRCAEFSRSPVGASPVALPGDEALVDELLDLTRLSSVVAAPVHTKKCSVSPGGSAALRPRQVRRAHVTVLARWLCRSSRTNTKRPSKLILARSLSRLPFPRWCWPGRDAAALAAGSCRRCRLATHAGSLPLEVPLHGCATASSSKRTWRSGAGVWLLCFAFFVSSQGPVRRSRRLGPSFLLTTLPFDPPV